MSEEDKKNERMKIIYKALEEGWTVKKLDKYTKTFEFSKNVSNNFKGVVLQGSPLLLDNITRTQNITRTPDTQESKKITKSASVPIFKN